MKRRALLLASGAWLALSATHAAAQAGKGPRRVAALIPGTESAFRSRLSAFRAELKKLGYVEGRDISIETRWADNRIERFPALAAELIALGPAVILTGTSAGVLACKNATTTVPIVFATAAYPVEQGFVASLRRPGGNVTGIALLDTSAKVIEIAREAFPKARRFGVLVHDADPAHRFYVESFLSNAPRFRFEPIVVRVKRPQDISRAFAELAERRVDILYLADLAFNLTYNEQLVERSLEAKLPLLSSQHDTTRAGGLLSYGTSSRDEFYRRAATLVDKILRGANPGELAIEQPDWIQMVVNRTTAKAIGAQISPITMLRADRIID